MNYVILNYLLKMQESPLNIQKPDLFDAGQAFLPDGIIIVQKTGSNCLVASKSFKKGDLVLNLNQCLHVPADTDKIKMTIKGVQYICDKEHSIKYEDYRYFPYVCSFMNHRCDANTIFYKHKSMKNQIGTQLEECFALRDISIGQEITCNYLYFYYDGEEDEQFQCRCGSSNCYGQIRGFKYLSLEDKIQLLPILYSEVRELWLKEDNRIRIIEGLQIPDTIYLDDKQGSLKSKNNFVEGEEIFRYTPMDVSQDSIIIIKKDEKYEMIDNCQLSQMNPNCFEYLSLYTRNENKANIRIISQGKEKIGKCIKDIKYGQCITQEQISKNPESKQEQNQDIYDVGVVSIPDGIVISKNMYGYCLKASKDFKSGDLLFVNDLIYVPLTVGKYKFRIGDVQYFGDHTNSVKEGDQRIIYHFGGYMNHSCDENSISVEEPETGKNCQVAIKDIKAGEEISCNYLHFDYDCDGHQFVCKCGSDSCFGQIKGFKSLSYKDQIKLLPRISSQVRQLFQQTMKNESKS